MRKATIVFTVSVLSLTAVVFFGGTKNCFGGETTTTIRTISANGTIHDASIDYRANMTVEQAIQIVCPESIIQQFSYGKLLKSIPSMENEEHNRYWYILAGDQPVDKLGPNNFLKSSIDKYVLKPNDNIVISYQGEATTTINKVKDFSDGNLVNLSGIVIANFGNSAYLEAKNRVCAIKIDLLSVYSEGINLNISGIIGRKDDIRQITNVQINKWTNDQLIAPFYLRNDSIGGADKPNQPGAFGTKGPNNIGLLITTTGKNVSTGNGYIIINDGSLSDGLKVITNKHIEANCYIKVTGISSIERFYGITKPVLITRSENDITIY